MRTTLLGKASKLGSSKGVEEEELVNEELLEKPMDASERPGRES